MNKLLLLAVLAWIATTNASAQSAESGATDSLYSFALSDLPGFSRAITATANTDYDRANQIVDWFARNFDWTATDYKQRTVRDILERRGGNCNELAMVARASMETLGLKMRRVREINIHVLTPRRQVDAAKLVAEKGPRMSVFGKHHNDHVWLEIYDDATGQWFPADPSLGVVGKRQWLAARYSFGKRYSLDASSADMIAPFAVFAMDGDNWIDRSSYYAVDGFNELYFGNLSDLPSWNRWVALVDELDPLALGAFKGEVNLHKSGALIDSLAAVYERLEREFAATDIGTIMQHIDAFSAALVGRDYDKVVDAYTPDASIFPDRRDILTGRDAIATYWTPPANATSRTVHHRVTPEEIRLTGDSEAYDWGYYEGTTERADGSRANWRGKYVIVWRKLGSDWKIYLDIWNRVPIPGQ